MSGKMDQKVKYLPDLSHGRETDWSESQKTAISTREGFYMVLQIFNPTERKSLFHILYLKAQVYSHCSFQTSTQD